MSRFLMALGVVLVLVGVSRGIVKPKPHLKTLARQATLRVESGGMRGSAIHLKDGIALSAAHVCELFPTMGNPIARDYKGRAIKIIAFEVALNGSDACILQLESFNDLPEMDLTKKVDALGTPIVLPSFAGGEEYSIKSGVLVSDETVPVMEDPVACMLSPTTCKFHKYKVIVSTAPAQPGASGSGVLNEDGEVIGITVLGMYGGSLSGITPLSEVIQMINESIIGAKYKSLTNKGMFDIFR